MKIGNVETNCGTKSTGEVFILASKEEAQFLFAMAEEYVANHKRSAKAKRVLDDLKSAACF